MDRRTFLLLPLFLLVILMLAVCVSAEAKAQGTGMKIPESPSPVLAVAAYSPAHFPGFNIPLGLPVDGFVITNNSTKAVVALTILWDAMLTTGPGHHTQSTDSFLNQKSPPILATGARFLVVSSGAFLYEGPPGGFGASGGPGHSFGDSPHIDCVIFEDGAVVGPNESHQDQEILGRKAAAEDVVRQVRAAQSRGEDVSGLLQKLAPAKLRVDRSDPNALWRGSFAQDLLGTQDFEGRLSWLEGLPTPPTFYRP
jgi:hypothetical protein